MADGAGFLEFSRQVMAARGLRPAAHHDLLIRRLQDVADGHCDRLTIAPPSISIAGLAAVVAVGNAITVSGAVSPAGYAVQIGLSSSATTAPVAWVSAAVNAADWSGSLTPAAAGTVYVWARQVANTAVSAVSAAISAVTASLTITAPATGAAGTALTVSGAVSPAADSVNVQLSTQNGIAPSGAWTQATNGSGNYTAVLTPTASGTYYAWAQDPTTGVAAVSSAISVAAAPPLTYGLNNPGGSYAHGTGTIGINGSVSPAQDVPTQVALSTSGTIVPSTGWQAATIINSNTLWAIYYTTPATAGNYYVWVQTTAGTNTAVSSFTIAVT
jgi:hypothetical protein